MLLVNSRSFVETLCVVDEVGITERFSRLLVLNVERPPVDDPCNGWEGGSGKIDRKGGEGSPWHRGRGEGESQAKINFLQRKTLVPTKDLLLYCR